MTDHDHLTTADLVTNERDRATINEFGGRATAAVHGFARLGYPTEPDHLTLVVHPQLRNAVRDAVRRLYPFGGNAWEPIVDADGAPADSFMGLPVLLDDRIPAGQIRVRYEVSG